MFLLCVRSHYIRDPHKKQKKKKHHCHCRFGGRCVPKLNIYWQTCWFSPQLYISLHFTNSSPCVLIIHPGALSLSSHVPSLFLRLCFSLLSHFFQLCPSSIFHRSMFAVILVSQQCICIYKYINKHLSPECQYLSCQGGAKKILAKGEERVML